MIQGPCSRRTAQELSPARPATGRARCVEYVDEMPRPEVTEPPKKRPGKLRDNNAIIAAKVAELLRSQPVEPPSPPAWIGIDDAAKLLGVSRATLDRAISELPPARRPARVPSRGKGQRTRYGWPGEDALRAWWHAVTAATGPARRARPKPRKRIEDEGPVDWSQPLDAILGPRAAKPARDGK